MTVELSDLVVECVERLDEEGPEVVEELCARHPEHAAALREAVGGLLDFGLAGPGSDGMDATFATLPDLEDFTLGRELGRGGMGVVYEARQESLDRSVALKIMHDHLLADRDAVERFRREATTLAGLRHRGIAEVYATGVSDGQQFLAMELLDGMPLDRLIGELRARPADSVRAGAISEALHRLCPDAAPAGTAGAAPRGGSEVGRGYFGEVAAMIAEVADALACAHAAGVVHRDVKPANILLRRDGSVVLNDFGLARVDDLPALTQTGAFAGTPFYTSPEQAAGSRDIDHRTDLFSLGATLYELLTLRLPFEAATSVEVLQAIRHREPTDPRRFVRGLPRDLLAIVQRALEKEPRRRYPDAAAMGADLRAFVEHRPVEAQPIAAFGRLARWSRRQPWQASLAATLAIGTPLVAVLGTRVYRDRERVAAAAEVARVERGRRALFDGYLRLGQNEFEAAIEDLSIAVEIAPEDPEGWAGQALAVIGRDANGMRAWLDRFEAAGPEVREARVLRRAAAQLRMQLGERDRATAELERLGAPDGALESFWVGMRTIDEAMASHRTELAEAAYDSLLDAVLSSAEARPTFHYWLTVSAGECGDERAARRLARAMQRLWPDTPNTWLASGLALHYVDPEGAIDAYRRALELDPDMRTAGNNLGNVLEDLGRDDEAIAAWRAVIERHPDYATPRGNLGRMLFYRRQFAAAREMLGEAVALDPRYLLAQHYLIWTLRESGNHQASVGAAEAAVAVMPEQPLMHRDLARSLGQAGQVERAIEVARVAVELRAAEASSLDVLGDLLLQDEQAAAALEVYERSVGSIQDPRRKNRALDDLAHRILTKFPDPNDAQLRRALEIATRLVEASEWQDPFYVNLRGRALLRLGREHEALQHFEEVLARLDDDETGDRARLKEFVIARTAQLREKLGAAADGSGTPAADRATDRR